MLVLRNLVVVSASAVIALGYSSVGVAAPKEIPSEQNSNAIDTSKIKSQKEVTTNSTQENIQENKLDRKLKYRGAIEKISQITPEEAPRQQEQNQDPAEIEPPLQRPDRTQPEEFPLPEPIPEEQERVPTIEGEVNIPPEVRPSPNPLFFPTEPEEVEIETIRAITLQQAVELALRNNKQLQISRQNLEVSRANLREAEAGLYPTLDATLQYSHAFSNQETANQTEALLNQSVDVFNQVLLPQIRDQGLNIQDLQVPDGIFPEPEPNITDTFTGTVEIDYGIYQGGRVKAQIRRAEKEVRRSQLQVEITAQEVRRQAARDYYNLQSADAQVEIDRASLNEARQSLRDAQLLEEAGLGTRFDVLTAEVELADVQQRLTNSIAQQQINRRQIATTLGVGQQIELRSAEPIQEAGDWNLSLEESIVLAYKNRAELEDRLLERESFKEQEIISLAAIRPQVGFFFNYRVQDEFNDQSAIVDDYNVGAQMTWRIFDGGAALAAADRAKIQSQIAETNFANERHTVRFEVEEAYYSLLAQKENITTTTVNVERAEENLRLARLRFQAGVGTQRDVIEAQRDLADARGRQLRAINDYNLFLNNLQRAVSNLPDSQLFEIR